MPPPADTAEENTRVVAANATRDVRQTDTAPQLNENPRVRLVDSCSAMTHCMLLVRCKAKTDLGDETAASTSSLEDSSFLATIHRSVGGLCCACD